jgi:hypothetical protein
MGDARDVLHWKLQGTTKVKTGGKREYIDGSNCGHALLMDSLSLTIMLALKTNLGLGGKSIPWLVNLWHVTSYAILNQADISWFHPDECNFNTADFDSELIIT